MPDLVVPAGPGIPEGLVVPGEELVERFSRSSGPGGQSVNTSDTRVELLLDLTTTTVLDDRQRERAVRALGPMLRVTASEHRSQHRNRETARGRLADRLRAALAPPAPARVPTKPSKGSRRRRLDTKKRRGAVKALRRRVDPRA
ncbi:MAG: alternative ribosome rescue aminoacyl-tRNA hydrolase ArfB [Marmoricola sp.]